ncbi:MAG TPA: DUF3570 domain-containing protein [Polyangia bacterium]|nr:DUF3570 domain-containing protein [Polyangia bacterium]
MQLSPGRWSCPRSKRDRAILCVVAVLVIIVGASTPTTARPPAGTTPEAEGEVTKQPRDSDTEKEADREDDSHRSKRGGPIVTASSAVSAYSDTDAVHVISPTVAGGLRDDIAGWSVDGRYLVDAVSAASVDIVSTASGRWKEIRHVGSLSAEMKSGAAAFSVAGGVSREPDYLSLGGGGTVSLELLDKNVTPFLGGSYGHDDVGRTGLPKQFWRTQQKGTFQLGVTFVVDRSTIAEVAVDGIFERGYLAKPYRYIPLFAPGVAASVPAGASVTTVNELRLDLRSADALPDSRDRYSLSGRIAHRFDTSTVRADQRLYTDSWGMLASTTDARLLVDVGQRFLLWPHGRLHVQRGIDFWERTYEATIDPGGALAVPRYRTGDRELGPLYTVTVGGGVRVQLTSQPLPWALTFQMEGIFTRYLNDLYITQRRALFGDLALEASFQ